MNNGIYEIYDKIKNDKVQSINDEIKLNLRYIRIMLEMGCDNKAREIIDTLHFRYPWHYDISYIAMLLNDNIPIIYDENNNSIDRLAEIDKKNI